MRRSRARCGQRFPSGCLSTTIGYGTAIIIDWMIDLPSELEKQFTEQLSQYEEEKQMPYVTSVERLAREQGREQGLLEGIEAVLRTRFGTRAELILAEVRKLSNAEILRQVLHAAQTVERPEDLAMLWSGTGEGENGARA